MSQVSPHPVTACLKLSVSKVSLHEVTALSVLCDSLSSSSDCSMLSVSVSGIILAACLHSSSPVATAAKPSLCQLQVSTY